MNDWKDRLADADDDYLIGLSNKGIVKRAHKDKEEVAAEVLSMGEEASVKVGEETVTVRFPLGESRCTCPSRSICRHVVQAILVLRESCGKEETAEEARQKSGAEAGTEGLEETAPQSGGNDVSGLSGDAPVASGGSEQRPEREAESNPDSAAERTSAAVMKEINEYPFAALKKVLKGKKLQTFAGQAGAGIRPGIHYASVVTVQLPEQEFTVKLLSPLTYSSCSCHKKELCVHKAAAILWCQLESGVLTKETLLRETQESVVYDADKVNRAAGQMKAYLEELFATGLSRISPEVTEDLERLAVISHNAELAKFEGYFRTLADSYDRYLKRKANFRTEDLMGQITRLYRRVELLLEAEDNERKAELAGEFRADYLPVGTLNLIGIAMEHFRSQAGYEGETVYFLEENTKKWYTYTNARPVFHDSGRRGFSRGYAEKGRTAPWGLNISFENLLKVRIRLTGAKCAPGNRLSSSQETKGEITGEQGLCVSDTGAWYYRDFDKLFTEQIEKQQQPWLWERQESEEEESSADADMGYSREDADSGENGKGGSESGGRGAGSRNGDLVIVRPAFCAKAEFSRTGQQLTLPLYDAAGRELLVEVTYSKEESGTIRYLERISERKLPCFLGRVWLKDGRIRMYPVDLLDLEEPFGEDSEAEEAGLSGTESESGSGGEAATEGTAGGGDRAGTDKTDEERDFGQQSKYEAVEGLLSELLLLTEDLYQSGFNTVHDSTIKDMGKFVQLTEQWGMKYLSELLSELAEELVSERHRTKRDTAESARRYTRVSEYLYLCRQKCAYDRGRSYYTDGERSGGK